jgi:hypothetical protein
MKNGDEASGKGGRSNEAETGVNAFECSFFSSHRVTNSTFHLALKLETSKNDATRGLNRTGILITGK